MYSVNGIVHNMHSTAMYTGLGCGKHKKIHVTTFTKPTQNNYCNVVITE
jgi:hypothetical protein